MWIKLKQRHLFVSNNVTFKIYRVTPQKDVFVLMLPTPKRFASKLPTENHNCLSLPTKVGFSEKVPPDERKRLGATHI